MSASSPVPKDHPLMQAWTQYQTTDDYANSRRWAAHEHAVDGSLWAAFEQGWRAAGGRAPFGPSGEDEARRDAPSDLVALVERWQHWLGVYGGTNDPDEMAAAQQQIWQAEAEMTAWRKP